jgi:small subunit ribosomal protein S6e
MIVVISDPKSGKSYPFQLPKEKENFFIGRKIGDEIDGGLLGASGYRFRITGGSDQSGFPMRPDISGPRRATVLISNGPGYRPKSKGSRRARQVRGNIISDEIQQVNLMVVAAGSAQLAELFPKKDEKKK